MHSHPQDELLRTILLERSVRFGRFKLASGQESDVYVDGKLTSCHARAMPLIGRAFLRKIAECGWRPQAVGGLTIGADPIAFAIARESSESGGPEINSFVVRKVPKNHGMQRFIEGIEDTKGCPVVIIDDVCTTGVSTAQAIRSAREAGMEVLGAVCLVDREMGASELLAQEGVELASIFTLKELIAKRDAVNLQPTHTR